jgi:hypothetical protein
MQAAAGPFTLVRQQGSPAESSSKQSPELGGRGSPLTSIHPKGDRLATEPSQWTFPIGRLSRPALKHAAGTRSPRSRYPLARKPCSFGRSHSPSRPCPARHCIGDRGRVEGADAGRARGHDCDRPPGAGEAARRGTRDTPKQDGAESAGAILRFATCGTVGSRRQRIAALDRAERPSSPRGKGRSSAHVSLCDFASGLQEIQRRLIDARLA